MEALEEQQQQQQDADAAGVPQQPASSELDHAGTATSNRGDASAAGALFISRSIVSTARKEEVQRLLCQVLVIPCELSAQYAAPVIIMSQEDSNIYTVLERHLKRDYLLGAEKFWRLVRAELGVDTWRPRVQGAQLKALQGARLPELEQEFQDMQRVVTGLQECIRSDSSPEALLQDLQLTIKQIQHWWEQRNRRPDGGLKRAGPNPAGFHIAAKRRAVVGGSLLEQHQLGFAEAGDQQGLLNDPAAVTAATAAAAAAAAASGYMDLGAADITGGVRLPFQATHLDPAAIAAGAAAAAAAAAAAGGGGAAGDAALDGTSLAAAAAAAAANPLAPFLTNPSGLLVLDVGGRTFRTSLNTLLAVQGSLFWQVVQGQGPQGVLQRLPTGEVFIDRSGEHFSYILEYLRACANNDIIFPLPNDAKDVQALAREAYFYQLPELIHHIQHTPLMPQPSTRTFFDMLYLETGFKSLEQDDEMKDLEGLKMIMMQQLNHLLHKRGQEGFAVEEILPGVAHRQDDDGSNTQHNLYYNVLLKKVVPLLPQDMLGDGDEQQDGEDEEQDEEEQQQQAYSAGSGGAGNK